jgi:hypothetical protein
MMMEEPVFDTLRTREQLGYSVFNTLRLPLFNSVFNTLRLPLFNSRSYSNYVHGTASGQLIKISSIRTLLKVVGNENRGGSEGWLVATVRRWFQSRAIDVCLLF